MTRLNGIGCFYCALPVRFTGDHRHPGYVVIEHVAPAIPRVGPDGLPDLRILHRFCSYTARVGGSRTCSSITLRRAWLGWATCEFEAGRDDRHYGIRHYPRLGLQPARLCRPELFRKYWRIRKMRCAAYACRYYKRCEPLPSVATSGVA